MYNFDFSVNINVNKNYFCLRGKECLKQTKETVMYVSITVSCNPVNVNLTIVYLVFMFSYTVPLKLRRKTIFYVTLQLKYKLLVEFVSTYAFSLQKTFYCAIKMEIHKNGSASGSLIATAFNGG